VEGLSSAIRARTCSGHKGATEFAVVGSGAVDGATGFGASFIAIAYVGFWCGVGMRAAHTAEGRIRG